MTERQMQRTLRRIMQICADLQQEGCTPDVVASGIRAIYQLVDSCLD